MSKAFQFNGTSYVSSLPFINIQTGNWFDVAPTGNAQQDLERGANCAFLLIKAMADDAIAAIEPVPNLDKSILSNIVISLMNTHDGASMNHVAGGFFWVLDALLQTGSTKLKDGFKCLSYDDLTAQITS